MWFKIKKIKKSVQCKKYSWKEGSFWKIKLQFKYIKIIPFEIQIMAVNLTLCVFIQFFMELK